jgi:hypothetical protein
MEWRERMEGEGEGGNGVREGGREWREREGMERECSGRRGRGRITKKAIQDLTKREVSTKEGKKFARSENLAFIETSAIEGINCERAVQIILKGRRRERGEGGKRGKGSENRRRER